MSDTESRDSDDEEQNKPSATTKDEKEKAGVDNEQPIEELKRSKRPRLATPFTEDVLVSADGLPRVYDTFHQSAKLKGRGFEAQDAKRLVTMYTEWAFQLYPGLSFQDMLGRIESFGSKPHTRSCLNRLREKERNRYLLEVFRVDPHELHRPSADDNSELQNPLASEPQVESDDEQPGDDDGLPGQAAAIESIDEIVNDLRMNANSFEDFEPVPSDDFIFGDA